MKEGGRGICGERGGGGREGDGRKRERFSVDKCKEINKEREK
jgi:hypothetical protein